MRLPKRIVSSSMAVVCGLAGELRGETFGDFTYEVIDSSAVRITDFPTDASGEVVVPAEIAGLPVTRIGNLAFFSCVNITSVSIPPSVTAIGIGAFSGCDFLTTVDLPSGLTVLEVGTFAGCSFLTSVSLPASLTRIGANAFASSGLSSLTIPGGVTELGSGAFSKCSFLTTVDLPDGLTHLPSNLFFECEILASISLPSALTVVDSQSFFGCTSLISVTIPANVTEVDSTAFRECSALDEIHVEPGSRVYSSVDGVLFDATQTTILDYPCGRVGAYTIPAGVTGIGPSAFLGCAGLSEVTIPAGVQEIGLQAFADCAQLSAILVEGGNAFFRSLEGVLLDRAQSRVIRCPGGKMGNFAVPAGVETIEPGAFDGCEGLTGIFLPTGITEIGDRAFFGCRSLVSAHLPDTVTSLGEHVFSFCGALVATTLPSDLTSIPRAMYLNCSELTEIELPPGVVTIGEQAFEGCVNIARVIFPSGLVSLEDRSFADCDSLLKAVFLGDVPAMGWGGVSRERTTLFYLKGKEGFTTPKWNGYDTVEIDEAIFPAATWLLEHGLEHDLPLEHDLTGEGVTLLIAYALDLNPHDRLTDKLPTPSLTANSVNLAFKGGKMGIFYRVEASSDLLSWTAEGVTVSAPDHNGVRTASIPRTASRAFLRLRVFLLEN